MNKATDYPKEWIKALEYMQAVGEIEKAQYITAILEENRWLKEQLQAQEMRR